MFVAAIYVAAMALANLSVAAWGPWISPVNAFLLIGLDLSLRDYLHDKWSGSMLWPRMLLLIGAGGLVSYAVNPAAGTIALASFAAFLASGIVDAIAYHALRSRPYLQRSNGSNVAGAAVDSLLFPAIAFGAFLPAVIALQFAAKMAGGFAWALLINATLKRRRETVTTV